MYVNNWESRRPSNTHLIEELVGEVWVRRKQRRTEPPHVRAFELAAVARLKRFLEHGASLLVESTLVGAAESTAPLCAVLRAVKKNENLNKRK